jgi:hypothetical protein
MPCPSPHPLHLKMETEPISKTCFLCEKKKKTRTMYKIKETDLNIINLSEIFLRVNRLDKTFSSEKPQGRNLVGETNLDRIMITKWIFREMAWTGHQKA